MQITPLPISVDIGPQIIPAINRAVNDGPSVLTKAVNVYFNSGPLRAADNFSNTVNKAIHQTKNVPIVDDYNDNVVTCTSKIPQLFVDPVIGIRQSTDVTYLPPNFVTGSNNLRIIPNGTVTTVSSNTVRWVDYQGITQTTQLNNGGRIIMAAGGIYTPYILQRSGFRNRNIGRNLITHYGCTMILEVDPSIEQESFDFSSGPLAFVPRSNSRQRDWQIVVSGDVNQDLLKIVGPDPQKKYFAFLLWDLNPKARGTVSVNSSDRPQVDLNLFEDAGNEDLHSITEGMRWMFSLAQRLNQSYRTLVPVYPPRDVLLQNNTRVLERYVKEGMNQTDHYCRTCALGTVVDPNDFSMYEEPNVHIVDASVFPSISDGNTAYPVAVMAEVAAERIGNSLE